MELLHKRIGRHLASLGHGVVQMGGASYYLLRDRLFREFMCGQCRIVVAIVGDGQSMAFKAGLCTR